MQRFVLRHGTYTQGDFACRETDGRATALVQPPLSGSDSRCGLHSTSADQEALYANLPSSHKTQPGTKALNPAKKAVKLYIAEHLKWILLKKWIYISNFHTVICWFKKKEPQRYIYMELIKYGTCCFFSFS